MLIVDIIKLCNFTPCIFYINTLKHYTQKHHKDIKYSIFHDLIEIYSFATDNFLFIMLEKCFSIAKAFVQWVNFCGSWSCTKFFDDGVMVMLLVAFLKRFGYECCVDHLGITTIAFVLSLYIFAVTFPSKLKGGNIVKFSVPFD